MNKARRKDQYFVDTNAEIFEGMDQNATLTDETAKEYLATVLKRLCDYPSQRYTTYNSNVPFFFMKLHEDLQAGKFAFAFGTLCHLSRIGDLRSAGIKENLIGTISEFV